MIAKRRRPAHPGQILLEKFLVPRELSQIRLAKHLRIPMQRINQLVNGKRGITPDTAWKLAAAFQTTPELWMKLQAQHDLAKCQPASLLVALRAPARQAARLTAKQAAGPSGKQAMRATAKPAARTTGKQAARASAKQAVRAPAKQ
ncbi:MAG: HigA family addiction module antitoxin, partial [Kofleriaceae bacterium]